ncbi:MAG: HEAT repeat domain-containing protein [Gemmatimonadetes bacterium]|nr:HEAT repeat domain-containing protein [Gemmatimonadota bacterium]
MVGLKATALAVTLGLVAPPLAPRGHAGVSPAAVGLPALDQPQQDQADSLFRAAREALNRADYQRAVTLFQRVLREYPGSVHAGDAIYWMAFVSYRAGGTRNLETALNLLAQQRKSYPDAATRRDGEVLATRIRGELARLGNAEAAESVFVLAAPPAPPVAQAPQAPPVTAAAPAPAAPQARRGGQGPECRDEDSELRAAALNALLQMDSERALPILKQVLERRDPCSVELRRKAMFLVSQKRGPEVEDILLQAARDDPDREVRTQAVFWLSQVPGERAVTALDSILLRSNDREVQEKAVFSLSQHKSARAAEILRRFIDRSGVSDELKANAIFWLGQRQSSETLKYLQDLYPRLTSEELKEKVIFSVSQMRGADSQRWLMDVALNASEPMEMRKKALFWAGQNRNVPIADLARLYDTMNDREMKEQLIFTYSQRREPEAVDQLMAIAENDPDGELRKKAIFWLGQSKDPRAAEFLLRIINK